MKVFNLVDTELKGMNGVVVRFVYKGYELSLTTIGAPSDMLLFNNNEDVTKKLMGWSSLPATADYVRNVLNKIDELDKTVKGGL